MSSLRFLVKRLGWWPEFLCRIQYLKDQYRDRRAFLVAAGPSLNEMDLSLLKHDFICVVNMGVRLVGQNLPHANMHVVTDRKRYTKFAVEIEELCLRNDIQLRFLSWSCKNDWLSLPGRRATRPKFILPTPYEPQVLSQLGPLPDLSLGMRCGSSVVIPAAQILFWMGFRQVYVIGCDLNYDHDVKYAYSMSDIDRDHYTSIITSTRSDLTWKTNDEFAALLKHHSAHGRVLSNAGSGGRLSSLPRTDFASLFDRSEGESVDESAAMP